MGLGSFSSEAGAGVVAAAGPAPDGDTLGVVVFVSADVEEAAAAGEGEDEEAAAEGEEASALSSLSAPSVLLPALIGPGDAAMIVSAVAAEVSEDTLTGGDAEGGASLASEPDREAPLSAGDEDLPPFSDAPASEPPLSEPDLSLPGLSPPGLSVPGLSVADWSEPEEGNFGLVVRADDRRVADADGGVDPAGVLADESGESELPDEDWGFGDGVKTDVVRSSFGSFDSFESFDSFGSFGASLPLRPLLDPPGARFASASGSVTFRTTVSG